MTGREIDGAIVGELALGELESWPVGICRLEASDDDSAILVYGENDHLIGRVELRRTVTSPLTGEPVVNLGAVAGRVNRIIAAEYAAL